MFPEERMVSDQTNLIGSNMSHDPKDYLKLNQNMSSSSQMIPKKLS
jgi:hypothetical protein